MNIDKQRYSREERIPQIGIQGRERISQTRILCVGAGALAHSALTYLVASGVKQITLLDDDIVELSNLHRQVQFAESDVGKVKVEALADRLRRINSSVEIIPKNIRFRAENALQIAFGHDVILDCTDNFKTKFLINDTAVKIGLPMVFSAISQFQGVLSVFWGKAGPCYRCYMPSPPQVGIKNCAQSGVLGAVAGTMGSLQAAEVVKLAVAGRNYIFEELVPSVGVMHVFELDHFKLSSFSIRKNPKCLCSKSSEEIVLKDEATLDDFCESASTLTALEFAKNWHQIDVIVDVREPNEFEESHIQDAINIPLSMLRKNFIPSLKKEQTLLLYCQSGMRSAAALSLFQHAGFTQSKHLKGGYDAWLHLKNRVSI